jgi:hypothetical protein
LIKEFKETRAKEENIKVKLKGFKEAYDLENRLIVLIMFLLNIIMMLQKKDGKKEVATETLR